MADSVGALARRYGHRVVLCTDPFLGSAPQGQLVLARLRSAGLHVTVLDAAEPELPLASVERALIGVRKTTPDVVVGLGGGSCLDLAKLVALGLSADRPLQDYYDESEAITALPPVIAMPTTAGTGSEVTPVAVLSDPSRVLKVGISSPQLTPVAAVCDPLLTHGAPPHLTAHAGIDALAHAIEAYCAVQREGWDAIEGKVFVGRNVLSDQCALRAIELLGDSLERAVADDPEARSDALLGSLYAGLAFATAGTALAHALQYPIGARTGTPHGMGVGVMLPHVMRFNSASCEDRLINVAVALGVSPTAAAAADRVEALGDALGLPKSIADMGLDPADLDDVVDQALGIGRLVSNNPRPATRENVTELVATAFGRIPTDQEAA
jgi:alcohol dehydrogenase